ncbi:vesicle transport through interaction with t-SNAREs homolog 1A-like [Lampetra planeri]
MSSDFETYEQDFGTITADVTNKIGRIPKLSGEEKTQLVLNVDKQLEEVRELLEQMDLEVREIPIQSRAMYNSRLKSYKQEMEKLEKDFVRALTSICNACCHYGLQGDIKAFLLPHYPIPQPISYWPPTGVSPLNLFSHPPIHPWFEVFLPPACQLETSFLLRFRQGLSRPQ